MDDAEFDRALIDSAFAMAASDGWPAVRVAEAARRAGLPLDRARIRFPTRSTVLLRFGRLADAEALATPAGDGPVRDRLFDILMRRIDVLQVHRSGVLALFRALPTDPCTALLLSMASVKSMHWMLEGAGVPAEGLSGRLRAKGLLAVWLWTMRAWQRDESADLSATMAVLDEALNRADRAAAWLGSPKTGPSAEPDPPPTPDEQALPFALPPV